MDEHARKLIQSLVDEIEARQARGTNMILLLAELRIDVSRCLGLSINATPADLRKYDPTPLEHPVRRNVIRVICAAYEGIAFAMKSMAILSTVHFSDAEKALALESPRIEHRLQPNGEAKTDEQTLKIGALVNLRFAFRMFAKGFHIQFELDAGGRGWQAIQRTVEVRDRITHPKAHKSLQISDDEIREAIEGFAWFSDQLQDMLSRSPANQKQKATP